MKVKSSKATRGQLREHNRQLILRSVYLGAATSRAALAQETGLTKPAVSNLVEMLIAEGFLIEEGFGESTDSGGKRPRLLRFMPDARQVIGVWINQQTILGVLTNLDGEVIASHFADLPSIDLIEGDVMGVIIGVINGLIAQTHAPLLCIGVGISGVVDSDGVILHAPRFGWTNYALSDPLSKRYDVPVHIANSSELTALAQYTFGKVGDISKLVTVVISNGVGVGAVLNGTANHLGSEIGHLLVEGKPLQSVLGWQSVRERISENKELDQDISYLKIRFAAEQGDQAALDLNEELASHVARIFAWVIALMRPDHLSLAGAISDLGEGFLNVVIAKTRLLVLPELVERITFSADDTPNLAAIGAAARSIQMELGLV